MKMLQFRIAADDGMLEARVDDGYYTIYQMGDKFNVFGWHKEEKKRFKGDNFPDIYEALDAANKHYDECNHE